MPPFLIRMLLWVRNPPSRNQQIAIALISGIGLAFATIEYLVGWPAWLQAERVPHGLRLLLP
ncbi:MAG: hypothetical protein O3C59_11955 [Proteobacteria bacterium]|nr:hypothetical protein [Pseudomonadota bacterium]